MWWLDQTTSIAICNTMFSAIRKSIFPPRCLDHNDLDLHGLTVRQQEK
jgi:hypothetical protein